MINHFYYNKQLKQAVITFAGIFTGLQVCTGKDGCGEVSFVEVPVRYGSTDRVASAIASGNTQNNLHTLPMMSCYMNGIELAPDRMHGVNQVDRRTYLEQGGVYPNDVKGIRRVMPIPYDLQMELSIYASNTDQMYQILEQILILFDYDLQVQFNDAPFDWAKITRVQLTGIANEETYPVGTDRRILSWNLSFNFPIWISPPMEIREDLIKRVTLTYGDIGSYKFNEYDEDGNLVPFDSEGSYGSTTLNIATNIDTVDPMPQEPVLGTHFDPSTIACSNDIARVHGIQGIS
jgi:hypothetical protein